MSDITGEQGDVRRGWHALLRLRVRKWTQTEAGRWTNRQPGRDCRAPSFMMHLSQCPRTHRRLLLHKSDLFPCCCSQSKLQDCKLHCTSIKAYKHYFNISKTRVLSLCCRSESGQVQVIGPRCVAVGLCITSYHVVRHHRVNKCFAAIVFPEVDLGEVII